jgi:ATP-dependent DNA helicase RecG
MQIKDDILTLKGVGEQTKQTFERLEIQTIRELLTTFPRDYADYSTPVKISQLNFDEKQMVIAEVVSIRNIYIRGGRGKTLQNGKIKDSSGEVDVMWFNMPFVEEALVPGEKYAFIAKLTKPKKGNKPKIYTPTFEKIKDNMIHTNRIVPIYSLTKGLSPKMYRRFVEQAVSATDKMPDFPEKDLSKYLDDPPKTMSLKASLKQMHFPSSFNLLEKAKFRLGIEELIPIQIKLLKEKLLRAKSISKTAEKFNKIKANHKKNKVIEDFWARFPFDPTADQKKVCEEIYDDFASGKPIYRLIQGDVGSGKTAVAAFAAHLNLQAEKDVVFMVPTTILAKQHFESFREIFDSEEDSFKNVQLITAETKKTLEFNDARKRIFIGTQALLHRYEDMKLDIGMVIVDEEHRFGVNQREEIARMSAENFTDKRIYASDEEKILPHYLSLTATPIPRTLALALFGNIDISVIETKPKQQLPKVTYLVPEAKREDSYKWIHEQITDKGNQVFWICPLIEEKEEIDNTTALIKSDEKATVEAKFKEVKKAFQKINVAKLHGKLKEEEKQKILNDFRRGKYDILVSTTVIEVGIDIPNANIIIIESANNFGLAQLHQLRGRVGRGEKQGYCVLFETSTSEDEKQGASYSNERLKYFAQENNGLKVAEYDLKTRGPGEVYGHVQSGVPNLKVADITNKKQMEISKQLAKKMKDLPKKYFLFRV